MVDPQTNYIYITTSGRLEWHLQHIDFT
jgi:hypothetical protein